MASTLFKQVGYSLGTLISYLEMGDIGLPDIQRPFVWKNIKVRDLFDSMYNGYPVGYLLFWENAFGDEVRQIGTDSKQKSPRLLVVDGQQRLTSLYAVIKGVPVVRQDYSRERIEIAFNPISGRFEVADAAIRRDRAYLPDVSMLWNDGGDYFELVSDYLAKVRAAREVSEQEESKIKRSIEKLKGLLSYPFTALELSSQVDEEQVSEVFVRINSKGTPLNQADFILTLMSVFWDEGRAELEEFCRTSRQPTKGHTSPFNHFIQPDPDQLLRVAIGLGFKRARLRYVYSILRGKDLETEEFSAERRDAQFEVLKAAQAKALKLPHWHSFLLALELAGFRGGRMITSQNNLIFCYVLYLIGRTELGVEEHALRRMIARWFFMSNLTSRYAKSPESSMEFDLAELRQVKNASEFLGTLDDICRNTLTNDFWKITLPNDLATSSARTPSLFAYYAALVLLDAKAFLSQHKVVDLLDPSVHSTRTAAERHHLFPRAYLETLGISDMRETNQIANFALTDWSSNARNGDQPPMKYLPELKSRFDKSQLLQMYHWHALPDGWEQMSYGDFLERRRELIAQVIKEAYETLTEIPADHVSVKRSVAELVDIGESTEVEFKSTLRINLHTGERDPRMEYAVLKTIAGFLNSQAGGRLVVGVSDDGTGVGLDTDGFKTEDNMALHLMNLIRSRLSEKFGTYVHPHFEDYDGVRVLVVDCSPSGSPVYLKDGKEERFYVRQGPSTPELPPSQVPDYVKHRFD